MNCIICDKTMLPVFTIGGYDIFECPDCQHRMTKTNNPDTHVATIYSNEYFYGGGAGYPNYLDEQEMLIQHGRYYGHMFFQHFIQPGSVLDIGAAAGFLLKGMADSGWQGFGIEPNNHMAAHAREQLGLDVQTATIETFQPKNTFDIICFIQVIAHLIAPSDAMKIAKRHLTTSGGILVETWNYKSLTARVCGKHWHEYSPPSILHWFSPKSLTLLMKQLDFELIAYGRPPKKIMWKHARSLIEYKLRHTFLLTCLKGVLERIPAHWVIPYPSEDLFWALFKMK